MAVLTAKKPRPSPRAGAKTLGALLGNALLHCKLMPRGRDLRRTSPAKSLGKIQSKRLVSRVKLTLQVVPEIHQKKAPVDHTTGAKRADWSDRCFWVRTVRRRDSCTSSVLGTVKTGREFRATDRSIRGSERLRNADVDLAIVGACTRSRLRRPRRSPASRSCAFAALLSDRTEDSKTAAQAIRTACRDKGFSPPRSRCGGCGRPSPNHPP
jgi:hypothetical protein